jgi:hypothetical protein
VHVSQVSVYGQPVPLFLGPGKAQHDGIGHDGAKLLTLWQPGSKERDRKGPGTRYIFPGHALQLCHHVMNPLRDESIDYVRALRIQSLL